MNEFVGRNDFVFFIKETDQAFKMADSVVIGMINRLVLHPQLIVLYRSFDLLVMNWLIPFLCKMGEILLIKHDTGMIFFWQPSALYRHASAKGMAFSCHFSRAATDTQYKN